MIVQKFSFDVTLDERPVYRGETMFGFFSKAALAQQVGVRGAKRYEPTDDEAARARAFAIEDAAPRSPEEPAPPIKPGLLLPGRAYRMIDRIDAFVPDGGPSGLGFIRGSKAVDPADWFFAAHFHQDPVWPGSLGLEGFIQLLKVVAIERWGADIATTHRFEPIALGEPHEWTYRGQVLPGDGRVEIEAAIERIDDAARLLHAGGLLEVDGRIIYQMKSFAVRAVPIEKGGGRR
jgi:3-hydroxymyristoyl/3-hydroxydecanoyl-(acyl carrier protein) dehydratase